MDSVRERYAELWLDSWVLNIWLLTDLYTQRWPQHRGVITTRPRGRYHWKSTAIQVKCLHYRIPRHVFLGSASANPRRWSHSSPPRGGRARRCCRYGRERRLEPSQSAFFGRLSPVTGDLAHTQFACVAEDILN